MVLFIYLTTVQLLVKTAAVATVIVCIYVHMFHHSRRMLCGLFRKKRIKGWKRTMDGMENRMVGPGQGEMVRKVVSLEMTTIYIL